MRSITTCPHCGKHVEGRADFTWGGIELEVPDEEDIPGADFDVGGGDD